MNLKELFEKNKATKTDINEHLDVLYEYATKCRHITEFGVRSGNSTSAFAFAKPSRLICYDVNPMPVDLENLLFNELNSFTFIQQNVLEVEIEKTDLLFIDTFHTYTQLKCELKKHKWKVRKFIILHDTNTFADIGEDGSKPGLLHAVAEELNDFHLKQFFENNNGLSIYRRI